MEKIRINCYEITTRRDEILLMFNGHTKILQGDKNYDKYKKILEKSQR